MNGGIYRVAMYSKETRKDDGEEEDEEEERKAEARTTERSIEVETAEEGTQRKSSLPLHLLHFTMVQSTWAFPAAECGIVSYCQARAALNVASSAGLYRSMISSQLE